MSRGPLPSLVRRRAAALAALAAASALAGAPACTDVPSDPGTPVSIEFDTAMLPSPSIIAGDTLRDAQGNVSVLRATVRNINGGIIADAPVQFILPDSVAVGGTLKLKLVNGDTLVSGLNESVAADSVVLSTRRQVRVVATIGNLQSAPIELAVVRRPKFLRRTNANELVSPYVYGVSDTNDMYTDTLGVRVLWHESADSGVRRIRVQYRIVDAAPDVLDSVRFVRDTTGRDTTSGAITNDAGYASRRLRIRAKSGQTAQDTVLVEARVILRPGQVLGPVLFRVPLRKDAPPATSP